MAETFLSPVRFYDTITLSDSKGIKWDTNNIISHNGTQTYLGDATSASTLTLEGGDASFEGNIDLPSGNIIFGSMYGVRFNDANTRIYTNAETPEDLIVEADQDLLLQPDGKVGINISNPNEKLHVEGTTRFNGDIHIGSSALGIIYRPVEGGSAIDRYFLMFDETNNASYPFLTNRTPNGAVVIKTGTAAGSAENEHFRIKGGDGVVDAYFTNVNLGIGTDSPGTNLQVNSSTNTATSIGISNTGSGASRLYMDASNGDFSGSDYMWIGQNDDKSGEIFMTQNSGSFHIKTQPSGTATTQFTIEQDGTATFAENVLVGGATQFSTSALCVDSATTNVVATFKSTDNQAWISVQDDDSGTYGALYGTDSDDGQEFVIANKSATKRIWSDTSGRIGIGPGTTGSPYDSTTFLHIKGTTRSIVQQSSTTDAYYMFGDAAANNVAWIGYNHSSNNLNLQSGSTITLYKPTDIVGNLSVDGKIHVGSGSPNGFIDVHADNGNWRVNSYGAMYFRNSSNATHESYIHSRSDGSLSIGRVAESNWTGSGAGAYASDTYDHVKFDTSSNAAFEGIVSVPTGKSFRLYNAAGTGWGEIALEETANKIQFNRGIQPSGDNQSDQLLGTSSKRWHQVHAGSFYGDGSNLTNVTASNCDTVDNLHAADFLRSNATDTASGKLTFTYSLSNLNSVGGNQGVTPFKSSFQATNRPGGGNYFTGIEYTFSDTGARGQLGFGSDGQNTVPHIYARTERWGQTDAWQSWYRLYHTGYHPEADQWTTARTVTFSGGDVTGNFSIDGSGDVSNVNLQVADDSHYHDSRYYTETEIDAKFTSSNGSEDEWKFTLGDESNLTGNKWYKVATINQGSGGLHIKGSFSNHVESFGTQHIDLLLQGREGNDGDEIEINGTVNVIHNAGTGTDKVGIRVIEADTSTSQYYHYYDVYMRTTRYTQAKFHLTKFGTTGFHTSKPSVTTEPAPVSGGSVELDTSTLASGNHVIVDSAVKSSIADSTGYVGLGVDPTSNQRLTLAEADANGSHIKMNNSRSGGGYWVVGVGDTNSSSGIVDPGGLFFYNGTTRLKFSSAGHATFANNVTITGDLQVNGTTTTVNQTNLDVSDNIIGLNRGISSNSNDSGLIIERGSTGDNAAMLWDEANDRFVFGLTTATPSATGSVSISATSNLAARDLDVNNITSGRILATASGTGIHQLVNASTNSTVLQLITTGDNPDLALNFQSDHIYNSNSALHIQNNDQPLYLKGSNTTVGTTTVQSAYELTVAHGPGRSIYTSGIIKTPTVEFENSLTTSASVTSASTTTHVVGVSSTDYSSIFVEYLIKNGTNVRAGTFVAIHDGTNVEFNETSTVDLGDTSDVTLFADLASSAINMKATTTSSTWTIKALIRAI